MRELKCHVQEARLGQVWKYHISWYQDPARLDNVVVVRSRPREGAEKLEISSWTNEVDGGTGSRETPLVFYVKVSWLSLAVVLSPVSSQASQVSVAGLPVVGAEVGLGLLYIDNNGAHHLLSQELTLNDDGSAGSETAVSLSRATLYSSCFQTQTSPGVMESTASCSPPTW